MRIKATVYRPVSSDKPTIGKSFGVKPDGTLDKGDVELLYDVSAVVTEWSNIEEYYEWLFVAYRQQVALTYGRLNKPQAIIFYEGEPDRRKTKIYAENGIDKKDWPRSYKTHKNVFYRRGSSILLAFDSDPTDRMIAAGEIRTAEDVWNQVCAVWPELSEHAHTSAHSASTFISIDGKQIVGEKGVRVTINVLVPGDADEDDSRPADIRAYVKLLVDRLIIAGYYSPSVSKRGTLKLKTAIDPAVPLPSQPDFIGQPAILDPRVTQDRPDPVFHPGRLDPIPLSTIQNLSHEEANKLAEILAMERIANAEEMMEKKGIWIENRVNVLYEVNKGKVSRAELRRRVVAAEESDNPLTVSSVFKLNDGRLITGGDIVANPSAYDGLYIYSPFDEEEGRSKALISAKGRSVRVLNFAHGDNTWYSIVDDSPPDDAEDFGFAYGGIEQDDDIGRAVEGPNGELIYAPTISMAMRVQPPPPETRRPVNFPTVAIEEVPGEADKIVSDTSDGIQAALGLPMELAVVRAYINKKTGSIIVQDYAEAYLMRIWIQKERPGANVMVLPGRTVDALKRRSEFGVDFFVYRDDDGNQVGEDDAICHKRQLVADLHHVGLRTLAGHVCYKPETEERCQHFHDCGKLKRQRAKHMHDFVIETAASLGGTLNPLLEGDQKFSANVLVTDLAGQVTADRFEWDYTYWQEHPALAAFLPFVEVRGSVPTFEMAGKGSKKALEDWAGMPGVSPSMSESEAMEALARWKRITEVTRAKPTRLNALTAIEAWVNGEAIIQTEGMKVVANVQIPPRRLEDTSAIILADERSSAANVLSRLGVTAAAGAGVLTHASKRQIPTKIIQVVPNEDGLDEEATAAGLAWRLNSDASDVPAWLAKNEGNSKKLPGTVRDLQAFVRWLAKERGPGVVMTVPGSDKLEFGPDVQVVGFMDVSATFIGAGRLRDDASWLVVIGNKYPSDTVLKNYLCSQHPDDWPPSLTREDGLSIYPSRAVFTKRDGTPHDFVGGWRKTGSDAQTDAALQDLIRSPVMRMAEWLAGAGAATGRGTLMVIFDRFPLVNRSSPFEGVPADLVLRFREAVPGAGWLLTVVMGMLVEAAAEHFGVSRDTVIRDRAAWAERGEAMLDLYRPDGGSAVTQASATKSIEEGEDRV